MRRVSEFRVFSEINITEYGKKLGENTALGFEVVNTGMSMGQLGPVWWAVMAKEK